MTRNIRVFACIYKLSGIDNRVDVLSKRFRIRKLKDNIIKWGNDDLAVIIDYTPSEHFICGRFLKLRKDAPSICNIERCTERDIKLRLGEEIKEESHFIMNIRDNIILAEYNHYSVRHFAHPLKDYLDKLFDVDDNLVEPIPDYKKIRKFKKEKVFNKFFIRVPKENIGTLEKTFGIPATSVLWKMGSTDDSVFEIGVRRTKKQSSQLDTDNVIEVTDKLLEEKGKIDKLRIDAPNSAYEFFDINFLFFIVSIVQEGKRLRSTDFYSKVQDLYQDNINYIKNSITHNR